MSDEIEELARRLVVGRKRDGRCIYDEQAKSELIEACRQPGASVSKLARACGVNANQLSAWLRRDENRRTAAQAASHEVVELTAPAFVPVHVEAHATGPEKEQACLNLQARLPNGVVVDLGGCDLKKAGQLIEALGRLRCSASTRS